MTKIGKSAEQWQSEIKKISESRDIPQSMNFFYSKGAVIFEAVALLVLTGMFLLINTAFFWTPTKHPDDHPTAIVISIIFLPGTIFFGIKACNAVLVCSRIDEPAVTLSKAGYQHGNLRFPWNSIENITSVSGYRRPPLIVVKFKNTDGKIDKDVIDLSKLRERHLEEYMNVYMSFSREH